MRFFFFFCVSRRVPTVQYSRASTRTVTDAVHDRTHNGQYTIRIIYYFVHRFSKYIRNDHCSRMCRLVIADRSGCSPTERVVSQRTSGKLHVGRRHRRAVYLVQSHHRPYRGHRRGKVFAILSRHLQHKYINLNNF